MRVWLSLVLILAAAIVLAACAGHDWASPLDLARALAGDTDMRSRLLVEWRMPRVLASTLVGVLLGIGGAVFQGVFRNPLAEPYLLGSAGGAALGATVALLVPLGLPQSWLLPALAFAGAWGATVLVIAVSRVAGAVDAAGILLAGVAVAAILGALRSFFMLALSDETVSLQVVLSWVLGGVQTPTWTTLGLFAMISAACLGLTMLFARGLDVLGLGETMAVGFGSRSSDSWLSPCSQPRSWWRPPSRSEAWSRSWVSLRRISHAGSWARCIAWCFRRRRWSERASSPLPMRSRARRCPLPRFGSGW